MSAFLGRKIRFVPNSTGPEVKGLRSLGISFGGEPIDTTDYDDDGFPTVLKGEVTNKGITLAVQGVTKVSGEDGLFDALFQNHGVVFLDDYSLVFDGISKSVTGDWVAKLSIDTEGEQAVSYSGEISSNGEWTYDEDSTD